MARIAPLQPPYPPEVADQLAGMSPPGHEPIALFRTFAKNLPMTQAMSSWGRHELGRTFAVGMREREIVIDRTCARCGAEYEWGVHVAHYAERVGLTSAQVTSLTVGGFGDACWTSDRDRLLIRLVDALHDHADIGDDLWALLDRQFTELQLLDLLLLCGWYHAISYVARGARVELEPWAPRFTDVAEVA